MFSWPLLYVALLFCFSCWCWGAHKPPAPTACTLLSILGNATFSFPVLAALVFVNYCECPTIFHLAKQRRENVWGVSEVGRKRFFHLFLLAVPLYLGFLLFSAAIWVITRSHQSDNV